MDLLALRERVRQVTKDEGEAERLFWEVVRGQAKDDLLCYGLWVHGDEAPVVARAAFARHIVAMAEGLREHRQTLFITPPEHFKTTLLQWHVEQWIGQETERHFAGGGEYPAPSALYIMNASGQSEKLCMLMASTFEVNERYKKLYPHVEPQKSWGWTKTELFLKRRRKRKDPTLMACGMFGPYQGFRFGLIVQDDPTDQRDAKSDTLVESQIAETLGVIDDRLLEGGMKRTALTLWGKKGIGNTLMGSAEWYTLVFPCYGQSPAFGQRLWPEAYPNYPWGRVLWPEEWPEERLEKKRREKQLVEGGDLWQLAYLCNPAISEGNMFKRAWLHYAAPPMQAFGGRRGGSDRSGRPNGGVLAAPA